MPHQFDPRDRPDEVAVLGERLEHPDERRQLTNPDLPDWSQSDPTVTCSALLALAATGWRDDAIGRAACDFVAARCTDSGWTSLWWRGTAYGTWLAVWALTELGGNRYRRECDAARTHLLATRRADRCWGDGHRNAFDTALAVHTLSRLAVPGDAALIRESAAALGAMQHTTGDWDGGAQMLAPGAQPLGLVLSDELVTTACAVSALHAAWTPSG